MQLWVAENNLGGSCYSIVLPQRPEASRTAHSECLSKSGVTEASDLPLNHSTSTGPDGSFGIVLAPGADHFTITDGTTSRTFAAAEGTAAYWYPPEDAGRTLTYTSYDRHGHRLQRITEQALSPAGSSG